MKLGETPKTTVHERDAFHVAVANVKCVSSYLCPSHPVGINPANYDEAGTQFKPYVGIVDPFNDKVTHQGERFLLILYPETTTSLKHVWTHPAFRSNNG